MSFVGGCPNVMFARFCRGFLAFVFLVFVDVFAF